MQIKGKKNKIKIKTKLLKLKTPIFIKLPSKFGPEFKKLPIKDMVMYLRSSLDMLSNLIG
jgi:hypothetical protein